MQLLINFIKRNTPVFLLGLIILIIFVAIILSSPSVNNSVPAGFKKVEEKVFDNREPAEPEPKKESNEPEYAPQVAGPENKGKPYFYGEVNPNLRDSEGYPAPPPLGSSPIPANATQEDRDIARALEAEVYQERLQPTKIVYTEKGFSPANATGYTGREIIWINNSTREIKIVEAFYKHEALKNGVVIKPGATFSFKPLLDGIFTYIEDTSKTYASVYVKDITTPLL